MPMPDEAARAPAEHGRGSDVPDQAAYDGTEPRFAAVAAARRQKSRMRTETLVALSIELQAARTLDAAYTAVTRHVLSGTAAAHVAIMTLLPDQPALTLAHAGGASHPWPRRVPVSGSRLGLAVQTGRPALGPTRGPEAPSTYVDDAAYRDLGPFAIMPLRTAKRAIGGLVAARAAGISQTPFGVGEVQLLEDVAAITAVAVARIRLTSGLQHAYARITFALARAVETHWDEPGSRAARLTDLAVATAAKLHCSAGELEDVRWGARLYDIGMAVVPDGILAKPDNLTEEEWEVVRQHPVIGDEMLQSVDKLRRAAVLARHHHERWDGQGYPDRLRGAEIPLGARILAVLGAYAAMTESRAYRPARSREELFYELRQGAGTQFDATVVDAFCAVLIETGAEPAAPPAREATAAQAVPRRAVEIGDRRTTSHILGQLTWFAKLSGGV
jgi:hypothetical protein